MPTVNIFSTNDTQLVQLDATRNELKPLIAKELSCSNIQLDANEVSIRLVRTAGSGMLADIEIEITAHAFEERIQRQDEICLRVREFLTQKIAADEVRVWLSLVQLGHSWE